MSKSKTIADLVTDLQKENDSLKRLAKIADRYCKEEFGYSVKELHAIISKFEADKLRFQSQKPVSQSSSFKTPRPEFNK